MRLCGRGKELGPMLCSMWESAVGDRFKERTAQLTELSLPWDCKT